MSASNLGSLPPRKTDQNHPAYYGQKKILWPLGGIKSQSPSCPAHSLPNIISKLSWLYLTEVNINCYLYKTDIDQTNTPTCEMRQAPFTSNLRRSTSVWKDETPVRASLPPPRRAATSSPPSSLDQAMNANANKSSMLEGDIVAL